MKRTVLQEVTELRALREMLARRTEVYQAEIENLKKKVLNDPSDKNLTNCFDFIHLYEKQIEAIWVVSRECRFEIEDITGEEEPY